MSGVAVFNDSFFAMGTRCDVVFTEIDQELGERLFQLVKNEVEVLEQRLSRFLPTSPISILNRAAKNTWMDVDGDIWDILTICFDFYQMSNGAFDITAAPLVNLWKSGKIPNVKEINTAKTISGFDKVEFDFEQQKIRFLVDGAEFDLGAIGKGVALDTVKPILKKQGLKNGIISFGESSILALGSHPNGKPWPLGIRNIFRPEEYVHVFAAKNETVTTSGTIINNDEGTPQLRKHIISPATGLPVQGRHSVSVKSVSAALGEFISTTFLILPENDKHILFEKLKSVEILEVEYFADGKDYKTKLFYDELRK